MFIDEELENTLNDFIDHLEGEVTDQTIKDLAKQLLITLIGKLPKKGEAEEIDPGEFLLRLKQLDNAWKLFCKRHPKLFNENFWRNLVLKSDTPDGKFRKALGW